MTDARRHPGSVENAGRLRARAGAARAASRRQRERAQELARASASELEAVAQRLVETPAMLGARGETLALRLPRTSSSVRLAREHLRRWLEHVGLAPEEVFEITLACSEACANAVEHPVRASRQTFELTARRSGDVVELAVRDFGRWRARRRSTLRGRGLEMIRRLMDETEVERGPDGATVVMRRVLAAGRGGG